MIVHRKSIASATRYISNSSVLWSDSGNALASRLASLGRSYAASRSFLVDHPPSSCFPTFHERPGDHPGTHRCRSATNPPMWTFLTVFGDLFDGRRQRRDQLSFHPSTASPRSVGDLRGVDSWRCSSFGWSEKFFFPWYHRIAATSASQIEISSHFVSMVTCMFGRHLILRLRDDRLKFALLLPASRRFN